MSSDLFTKHGARSAVIMAESGERLSFQEMDDRSLRLAQALHAAGLRPGEHLAVLMENNIRYYEVVWAATRSGLYVTPINWHLTAEEARYIVDNCGAKALITSRKLHELATGALDGLDQVTLRLVVDGASEGFGSYENLVATHEAEAVGPEVEGAFMFYSSGTTGQPKGILPELSDLSFGEGGGAVMHLAKMLYGVTDESIYLCPAPLYHAAPIGWTAAAQRLGCTIVVMENYDAEEALAAIDKYSITHAQFVPTHFVRMLKLDQDVRDRYDVSSLTCAIHAAAPCPIPVKRQMIDWWGPCIYEYYAGSEATGLCAINSEEWLSHPGSVGKPMLGIPHILDEDGQALPVGESGQIWFESDVKFEYYKDKTKTDDAFNEKGWSTLGDVGYVDEEGFVYLTDRISHMIISGGVNIYPQEIENLLTLHPDVVDVAVIGVANAEMGEEVKAVVIASDPSKIDQGLEEDLIAFCRKELSHFKCPRTIDFVDTLPRTPTGKLLKRKLRDQYASS